MKKLVLFGFSVFFFLLGSNGIAAAESFLVFDFGAEGLDASTARIARALFVSELSARGAQVSSAEAGSCVEEACAREALTARQVDAAIVGEIFKLGETTILKVAVVRVSGVARYNITMRDIGEMDRVAPRLARAVIERIPYDETTTVETVTRPEQETYRRIEGDFSWGPAIGGLIPLGGSYGGNGYLNTLTMLFRYETAHLGFEFETGVYFDGNDSDHASAGEFPMDFSLLYYFSTSDVSPFLGGGIGLHYIGVTTEDKHDGEDSFSDWAPVLSATGGFEALRTHRFHVLARGGYRWAFAGLDGRGANGPYFSIGFAF